MSKLVNNIESIRNIILFILKNKLLTIYFIKKVIKLKSKRKIEKKTTNNHINYLQNKLCFRKEKNNKTVNCSFRSPIPALRTK